MGPQSACQPRVNGSSSAMGLRNRSSSGASSSSWTGTGLKGSTDPRRATDLASDPGPGGAAVWVTYLGGLRAMKFVTWPNWLLNDDYVPQSVAMVVIPLYLVRKERVLTGGVWGGPAPSRAPGQGKAAALNMAARIIGSDMWFSWFNVMFFIIYNVVNSIKWIPHGTMKNINTIKLVTSLGFHPRNDSFNCEIFDVGQFRLHVMNWQSLTQTSLFAVNELQTNEPVSTVLQSFPDDVDGRSRLPPFCYIFFQPKAGSDSRLINPSH